MRRRIIAISASALAILGLTAGTTLATTPYTLDQKQELTAGGTSAWTGSMVLAQTFTPSITGPLSEVDVYVAVTVTPNTQAGVVPAAPSSLMVQIVTTDAGDHFPTTTVVESANLSPSGDPGWTPVSFGTPKPVTAGTVYAIVITPTSGYNLGWSGTCSGGQYSPGEALMMDAGFGWRTVTNWAAAHGGNSEVYCQQDFAFREYILPAGQTAPPTYTDSPADKGQGDSPSPLLLGGLGAGVLMAAAAAAFVVRRHSELDRP